jgi:hypothetical protein
MSRAVSLPTLVFVASLGLMGCGSSAPSDGAQAANLGQGNPAGGENQPCAPNDTCDEGLFCVAESCVAPTLLGILAYQGPDGELHDPPDGTEVQVVDLSDQELVDTVTVSSGIFSVSGLAAGSYMLKTAFIPDESTGTVYTAEGGVDWPPQSESETIALTGEPFGS